MLQHHHAQNTKLNSWVQEEAHSLNFQIASSCLPGWLACYVHVAGCLAWYGGEGNHTRRREAELSTHQTLHTITSTNQAQQ